MSAKDEILAAVRSGKSMGQIARERGISEQAVHGVCKANGVTSTDKHCKPVVLCSVDGCERPKLQRGLCRMHWDRWFHHGSTDDPRYYAPCGTLSAARRHRRRGEPVDASCHKAEADAVRAWKARRSA